MDKTAMKIEISLMEIAADARSFGLDAVAKELDAVVDLLRKEVAEKRRGLAGEAE